MDDANKKEALLNEWADEMPAKMYERYEAYALKWDYTNENDTLELARTLYNWIVIEKIARKELNLRIQLFDFLNKPGLTEYMPVKRAEQPRSYKAALQSGGVEPPNNVRAGKERLHQPTSFQMEPLRHPRPITEEERDHLNMILSRRLEEASPPAFLTQIFTPGQVAIFMELLQEQEYALYGHLMAGHFVREGLSQSALFQLVDAGPAAVADQQQHVQRLRSEIVRMELNQDTRVVTFFFRSQRVAKQWNGMVCPFDGKGLRLVDYEEIRRQNPKAILRIDTYRFSLLLLRGKISPVEMYDLLTKELKLKVISIKHPILTEQTGGRERWEIIVDGPVCPPVLTSYTRIQLPKTHLLIHLSDVHIQLPCGKCSNKWHSHLRCPVQHEDCKQAADKRTLKIMRQEQASSIKKEIASTGPSIQNVDQLFEFFAQMGAPETKESTPGGAGVSSPFMDRAEGFNLKRSGQNEGEVTDNTHGGSSAQVPTGLPRTEESSSAEMDTDVEMGGEASVDIKGTFLGKGDQALTTDHSLLSDASHTPADPPAFSCEELKPSPVVVQQKRARSNTEVEKIETSSPNHEESTMSSDQDAATRVLHQRVLKQLSGRRQTKIMRQGSITLECSIATPSPVKQSTPHQKALKQQSLFEAFSGAECVEHGPVSTTFNDEEMCADMKQTLSSSGEPAPGPDEMGGDEEVKWIGTTPAATVSKHGSIR